MSMEGTRVAVVGGGLVGALNAINFAQLGCDVDVYELRSDIRQQAHYSGKSINLALSVRGIEALKAAGVESSVIESGLPMQGRLIHGRDGSLTAIPYGQKGQVILSVDRRKLNEHLLSCAEQYARVKLHFDHRLTQLNCDTGELTFQDQGKVKSDLVIGCDGAHSIVRRQMMRATRMDYSQHYIEHGYKELAIYPKDGINGQFQMSHEHLHIWPREEFMMIALPNQDGSFTVTLFMPFEKFDLLDSDEQIISFFEQYFEDSIALIGRDDLIQQFRSNPVGPLMTVKCTPYHVGSRVALLGDAAHAMVPFYGQGMNTGFEDALILREIIHRTGTLDSHTLETYTRERNDDAKAICDLALYNYIEMRSSVNSLYFRFRKRLDLALNRLMPDTFIPLYSMVTFSRIPFATVIRRRRVQDHLVDGSVSLVAIGSLAAVAFAALRFFNR